MRWMRWVQFIKAFPDAYATDVGTGGLQLSGGQKQVEYRCRIVCMLNTVHCVCFVFACCPLVFAYSSRNGFKKT